MIKAKINGIPVEVKPKTTILEAARMVQVKIPTLCKHADLLPTGACGVCIVKVDGSDKMLRACCTEIEKGMDIITHDPEIVKVRKNVLELILSNHPNDCLKCGRNNNCELQSLAAEFGIREDAFPKIEKNMHRDDSTKTIVLEPSKCILCGRCIQVCQRNQDTWALSFLERGINTRISPAGDISLSDSPCVRCGQCSNHCPTGAIFEYDDSYKVWDALRDPDKYCVAQIAPAVRVAIGEAFGFEIGVNLTNKLVMALKRLGFKAVFDTSLGADVTVMEEASEFVKRFEQGGPFPLITTCCPSWVDFMEKFHPDMMEHFSSCKSPQAIIGSLSKTFYAEQNGLNPAKMCMVSIMPCTAKKYEITRGDAMFSSGYQDIDLSITTRELARMLKQAGVDFRNIPGEQPTDFFSQYSGAGVIFGSTGGVMEAALRTAAHIVTGHELEHVEIKETRGLEGIKEGEVKLDGKSVKIAVAHGLKNVEKIMQKVREAREAGSPSPYHFIEVMACAGGCIGGGGQPYGVTDELRKKRSQGLYKDDADKKIRFAHRNPSVVRIYKEFLGEPLGKTSKELLHTTYKPRPVYRN